MMLIEIYILIGIFIGSVIEKIRTRNNAKESAEVFLKWQFGLRHVRYTAQEEHRSKLVSAILNPDRSL